MNNTPQTFGAIVRIGTLKRKKVTKFNGSGKKGCKTDILQDRNFGKYLTFKRAEAIYVTQGLISTGSLNNTRNVPHDPSQENDVSLLAKIFPVPQ